MAIPHRFDSIFQLHADDVPVSYLRALAWGESAMDPNVRSDSSTATGLFQILRGTLQAFEARHGGRNYDPTDASDATEVAVDLIHMIQQAYEQGAGVKPDWNNRNYVGLVTLGYKAGWTSKMGVLHGMQHSPRPWTVRSIIATEGVQFPHSTILNPAGGGYMSDPRLLASVEKTVSDYFKEVDPKAGDLELAPLVYPDAVPQYASDSSAGTNVGGLLLATALVGGFAYAVSKKRK